MAHSAATNLKRAVTQRGKNSLEIERDKFESHQVASITKAINSQEVPAKEKHVRVALIGTHKDKSSALFWRIVTTHIQLQGNPVVCWKFCHVLHRLLRDGHPKCLVECQRYKSTLRELGKLWRHLQDGYGRLIAFYTKLLLQKLRFHEKYEEFPGTLLLSEEDFEKFVGNDVNVYFELTVDFLDYMDDILAMQHAVFASLDMSRSNSMTAAGQCRLAPLIPCIQDSCQLYDYCVRMLFKLHSSLPPDTLGGHRSRFYDQYNALKKFYTQCANLQFFKNLIRVPHLPSTAPNFLVASNLDSHVKPVAIVPDPEPELHEEIPVELLIDTSSTTSSDDVDHTPPQNGAPSPQPPQPDERDLIISRLMHEISELKQELARIKAEDGMLIESLNNRIRELEMELNELRQIAESTQLENEALRTALKDGEKNTVAADRLCAMEQVAKVNDEKFKKMKDIYTKLREDHVTLLRSNAEVKKEFSKVKADKEHVEEKLQTKEQEIQELTTEREQIQENLQQSSADSVQQMAAAAAEQHQLQNQKQDLESHLQDLEGARDHLNESLEKTRAQLAAIQADLQQANQDRESDAQAHKKQLSDTHRALLESAVEEGHNIIKDAMDQSQNPYHLAVTCTAEYLLNRAEPVLTSLTSLKDSYAKFKDDRDSIADVIKSICDFSHRLGDTIVQGIATSHGTSNLEEGEALAEKCKDAGQESLNLLGILKQEEYNKVGDQSDRVKQLIEKIMAYGEQLLPKIADVEAEKMGDMVDQELQQTTDAIEQAAKRFAEMMAASQEQHSGVRKEVNAKILDSCTSLTKAIRILIQKSKVLQREIVEQGRGASSKKEFYKKHHRWTEGLISAAKAVGWGANVLTDSADKVVKGEGKFEELIVCSQEIAASTTQLVVASKVKADRNSKNMKEVSEASRGVTSATGSVVASAKSGAQMIEDMDLDFSHMTLHQAKRAEMESQVRVLELESDLDKERVRLSELRKTHYRMAGESEGWEQENGGQDIDNQG